MNGCGAAPNLVLRGGISVECGASHLGEVDGGAAEPPPSGIVPRAGRADDLGQCFEPRERLHGSVVCRSGEKDVEETGEITGATFDGSGARGRFARRAGREPRGQQWVSSAG